MLFASEAPLPRRDIMPEFDAEAHAAEEQAIDRPLRKHKQALPPQIAETQRFKHSEERLPVISGFEHELTQHWIQYYSKPSRLEWIAATLKTGEPYLGFIRQEVETRRLPPEFVYLPLIESGFLVTAKSHSGARGLWQFMRNSMAPYMKLTEWVDERLDFWKSTHGALSKLEEHYKQFGSWPLALAAYNSGGGAISRVIKTTGNNDYWKLAESKKLKTESIHYVPKLLAIYYIVSNPRKFNLNISLPQETWNWTRVEVPKQADLAVLAEHAGLDLDQLRRANRELATPLTPPEGGYFLKVRTEDAEAVQAVLARDDIKLIKRYIHTIKSGDTLFAMALQYGVSVESILAENPGVSPQALQLGSRISIPAIKAIKAGTAIAAPPKQTAPPPALVPAPKPDFIPETGWTDSYTVRRGDTLWSLARAYKTNTETLAQMNSLSTSRVLSIGQILRVPAAE